MRRVDHIYKNVKSTLFTQIPLFLLGFLIRRVFIVTLGEQYLGLNGLFTNILSMLSVAELGVGTSITFSLYKPVAEGDKEKVKSLMRLYRRAYTVIGILILVVGASLTPFLDFFVKEMPRDIEHVQLIYLLNVLDSGISYFFSYKASLLFADQKRYVETYIRTVSKCAFHILQLIVLIFTRNYILYVLCMVGSSVVTNVWISLSADKAYPYLREKDVQPLQASDKADIKRNVSAMMFHRLGDVAVYGTDNILMAKFVSLAAVGLYSNYLLITDTLHRIINKVYSDIMASMGNLNAMEGADAKERAFRNQIFFSTWIFGFCVVCLYHLYNPFITLWLGEAYLFPQSTVAIIVFNFYITAMRKPVMNTKDAMGLFRQDRFVPLFEVPINFIVSIVLAKPLGILGILIGTAASTLLVPFWVQPIVLYRFGLGRSPVEYFVRYFVYAGVVVAACGLTGLACMGMPGGFLGFLGRGVACVVVPNCFFLLVYHRTEEFHYLIGVAKRLLRKITKRRTD